MLGDGVGVGLSIGVATGLAPTVVGLRAKIRMPSDAMITAPATTIAAPATTQGTTDLVGGVEDLGMGRTSVRGVVFPRELMRIVGSAAAGTMSAEPSSRQKRKVSSP